MFSRVRAVADAPAGRLLRNAWLSCLLILEEKGIPSPVPLPVQASLLTRKTSPHRQSFLIHITYPAAQRGHRRIRDGGGGWGKHPYLLLDHAEIRGAHACTVTDHRDVSPPDNPTVCDAVTRSCAVTFSQPRSVSANIRAEGKMSQR